jgi:hypothetical protein
VLLLATTPALLGKGSLNLLQQRQLQLCLLRLCLLGLCLLTLCLIRLCLLMQRV